MASGYEDIDRWSSDSKTLLQQQQEKQEDLTNRQTQLEVNELERQKQQLDRDTIKATRGLYTDYQKQANQYGVEAERQAQMGLANSGYSETSKVNLYNGYQKNVTETLNNSRQLKSDFDFKIAQAREQGNINLGNNALALYQQQMQLLTQEYEMRYQRNRDMVADNQWQQSFDYQKQRDSVEDSRWQTQFDYQKQRDAVADSQWEKQYALSKKASASRSSSRSSSKKSSGGLVVTDNSNNNSRPSQKDLIDNMKVLQRPGNQGAVLDGISGKTFGSFESLLNYYGYATAK